MRSTYLEECGEAMLEESLLSIALYNADLGHTAPGQAPEKRRLNLKDWASVFCGYDLRCECISRGKVR